MAASDEVNLIESRTVVPLNTWVLISNFKLAYNLLRRPDGTFNRHLAEFLDRKVTANANPVDGVFSFDVIIDRRINLLSRVYRPACADQEQPPSVLDLEKPVDVPVILFFHGGSFAHSSANSAIYDTLCRRLVGICNCVVVSVNYRRAPENPYPCAYDDGWIALNWVNSRSWLKSNKDSKVHIFLAGDSSGGNIAHNRSIGAEIDRQESGDRQLLLWFFAVATAVKLLLIPSYRSTDFEFHRNWLAVTHSLPLSKWYFDETSQWTLDYPLFFAYFERFLSVFAVLVDPMIVDFQSGLDYSAESVIYFQCISVIVSDLCFLFGVYRLTRKLEPMKRNLICVLVIWSPGLLIGFLLGWLLLSISFLQDGRDLLGGFLFAVLLCFKHLFAVAAPVYFVYLLRHYCWSGLATGFRRLATLARWL